jgi:hypothetical protein
MDLVEALGGKTNVVAVELRPPRAELEAAEGMDAWIDTYHAVRRLTRGVVSSGAGAGQPAGAIPSGSVAVRPSAPRRGLNAAPGTNGEDSGPGATFVFLTDSAVGTREEDNLRHLVANLGRDAARERIVPFLTSKHTLGHCLSYAERARQEGFPALVVLGGDRHVGIPRCVEHASELRQAIRRATPGLRLGGWANPYADQAAQAAHLAGPSFAGDFFLTQVVTHHDVEPVERFLGELDRRRVVIPGLFGVFFYRSANLRTLSMLSRFLPVPVEALVREFGETPDPVEVCARTLRTMLNAGVRHFYISNLPVIRAQQTLGRIMERAVC